MRGGGGGIRGEHPRVNREPGARCRTLLAIVAVVAALAMATGMASGRPAVAHPVVKGQAVGVVRVVRDRAVFRVGPTTDHDRRTPLEKGALLSICGRSGAWLVADLGAGDRGWVEERDVEWMPPQTQADVVLRNVLVRPTACETRVDIETSAQGSFDVIEELDPPALVVRLHRTTSMIHEIAQYCDDLIVGPATVRQVEPARVELRFPLARKGAWGYRVASAVSPNLPGDPSGHDFRHVGPCDFRITLARPPDVPASVAPAGEGTGAPSLQGVTVVLDPGHGGSDSGAVGVGGLVEKEINLAVALQAREALRKRGARVVMTRDVDRDTAPARADELSHRVEVGCAEQGHVFVSIHHNARPRVEDARVACGVFVYYYQPWSADLARALVAPVADAQREAHRAYVFRSFAVTRQTYMPSVLVEVGFISNPQEEQKMRDPGYAPRIGEAIASGIERWFTERGRRP